MIEACAPLLQAGSLRLLGRIQLSNIRRRVDAAPLIGIRARIGGRLNKEEIFFPLSIFQAHGALRIEQVGSVNSHVLTRTDDNAEELCLISPLRVVVSEKFSDLAQIQRVFQVEIARDRLPRICAVFGTKRGCPKRIWLMRQMWTGLMSARLSAS